MSGIGVPSISQIVRIIHLGECSVANPNLKNNCVMKRIRLCEVWERNTYYVCLKCRLQ